MDATAYRFLDGFTPVARERLLGSMIHQFYSDGAYLFKEGDEADGVYLVLDGRVEIVRAAGNHEKILDSIPPGEYFGEIAVLDGLGRSASARARGDTSIGKIPGPVLLEVLANGPGTQLLGLLKHVMAHLRRTTNEVVHEIVHKEKLSLVGEMASSIMHDLRSPVSNILLSTDLIDGHSRQGKIPQWCAGIRLQCERLVGMTAELMEFSKGEATLTLVRTNTTAFLDQFKTLNPGCISPLGIKMQFKAKPGEIEIDSMRIQRVLQNLVTNAIEALHATAKPRVEIKAWVKDSTFHLGVKDNGPGIPAAIQGRLFEPFVTHGKSRGIGLGMAIVRNIVTAHGGSIAFETAPNQGTSFLVSLPQTPRR